MSRPRLAVAVAIPLLLAIGLAFTFLPAGSRPTPPPPPPSQRRPPSPTPPPASPTPKATGEDWLAIMTNIPTFRHEFYEHPQPDLLSQIYDKRCPCYARERATLVDLQRRGWRCNDQGVKVLSAKLLGRPTTNRSIIAVEVVSRTPQQSIIDRAGTIVQRQPPSGPTKTAFQLLLGADGRYRVTLIGISQPEDQERPMVSKPRDALAAAGLLLGIMALILPNAGLTLSAAKGQEGPGGGGVSPDKLWVNAKLGQPPGGARGATSGGPLAGHALRYIRLGAQPQCTPVSFQVPPGIQAWFGTAQELSLETESVEVVSVNRQNPTDQVPLGLGCVNPTVLVQVPTAGRS